MISPLRLPSTNLLLESDLLDSYAEDSEDTPSSPVAVQHSGRSRNSMNMSTIKKALPKTSTYEGENI